jgi:hypothetical protein
MMTRAKEIFVTGTLALLCLLPLSALAIPLHTFEFAANCDDCAAAAETEQYLVNIKLELKNYQLGNEIRARNFHAFSYTGSNLVEDIAVGRRDWSRGRGCALIGLAPISYIAGDAFSFSLTLDNSGRGKKDDLWSCTSLGWAVADPTSACEMNQQLIFTMSSSGAWQLGNPAKDHGDLNTPHPTPEPSTLLLGTLGLVALRRFRRSRST